MHHRNSQIPKTAGFAGPSAAQSLNNTRNHQGKMDSSLSQIRKSNYVENAKRKFIMKNTQQEPLALPSPSNQGSIKQAASVTPRGPQTAKPQQTMHEVDE